MRSHGLKISIPGLEDTVIMLLIISALAVYDINFLFLGTQLLAIGLTGISLVYHQLQLKKNTCFYFCWMLVFCLLCFFSSAWTAPGNTTAISCSMSTVQVCLITFAIIVYSNTKKRAYWVIKSFIVACIILAIRFFLTVPVSNWGNQQRFSNDTFFGSNTIAMVLAYGAALLLMIYLRKRRDNRIVFRWPYFVGIFVFMFVSMMLGTKKGILIFSIIVGVIIIGNSKNPLQLFGRTIAVLALAVVGYYAIMNVDVLYNAIGYRIEAMVLGFTGGKGDNSTAMRMVFISAAWEIFLEHPILGVGIDGFRYLNPFEFTYSHNNYVEMLSELGIIGGMVYYSIWIYLTRRSIKAGKKGLNILALVATVFVTDMASVSYSNELTYIILAICLIIDDVYLQSEGYEYE